MKLPALQTGTLVKRYKRFLADITTAEGETLTAHCPNTGAMTGCAEPGSEVWFSRSDNPARKYPHTLEIVRTAHGLVSVNTGRANALVGEALSQGRMETLADASGIQPEAKIPDESGRFDFRLTTPTGPAYVEVKSATLYVGDGVGAFPDAVSTRALKHLAALERRVDAGDRGLLVFCAQHCGVRSVRAAHEIDPQYASALQRAAAAGVEVLAYGCSTDLDTMEIDAALPVQLCG